MLVAPFTVSQTDQHPKNRSEEISKETHKNQGAPQSTPTTSAQAVTVPRAFPARNGSNNQQDEAQADVWMAIFSGLLVVVAALQWWAMRKQAKYMRDGLEQTRKAADAAKSSAETAVKTLRITQRPVVGFGACSILATGEIRMELKNDGPTAARNVIVMGDVADAERKQSGTRFNIGPLIIPPDAMPEVKFGKVPMTQDSSGQVSAIYDVRCAVNLFYEDIFRDTHTRSYLPFFDR